MGCSLPVCSGVLVGGMLFAPSIAEAASGTADPTMSQAEMAGLIDALEPGDTLTLAPGTYQGRTLDLVHADGTPLAGTSAAPITIVGDTSGDGLPRVIADTDQFQEAVRFATGNAFIVVSDLALSATGSTTQAGIRVEPGTHDLTIARCEIFDVTGIGIQIQTHDDVHDVTVEDTHIHDTGTNTADGNNGGQAFTAGGFTADTATTGVYRLLLRHNLIHDTRGQEGDCMKLMYGVYQSVMEDNVLYNCPRGVAQAENYGLTSYGSGSAHAGNPDDDNVIRRNLLVNTRGVDASENNVAIYAGPGTRVENNLIISANIGIAARLEDEVSEMRNLRVVHNTVYDVTDHAFSIRGTDDSDASVVVANNVFIAVDPEAFGYRAPDPLGGMVFVANLFTGQEYQEATPPAVVPITQPLDQVFVAPTSQIDQADFLPAEGSVLVDAADPGAALAEDFNLAPRPFGDTADIGAYELRDDLSNHWQLGADFKGTEGAGPIPGSGSTGSGGMSGAGGDNRAARETRAAPARCRDAPMGLPRQCSAACSHASPSLARVVAEGRSRARSPYVDVVARTGSLLLWVLVAACAEGAGAGVDDDARAEVGSSAASGGSTAAAGAEESGGAGPSGSGGATSSGPTGSGPTSSGQGGGGGAGGAEGGAGGTGSTTAATTTSTTSGGGGSDLWIQIDYASGSTPTSPSWSHSMTPGWTLQDWATTNESWPEVWDPLQGMHVNFDPMGAYAVIIDGEHLQLMIGLQGLVSYTGAVVTLVGRGYSTNASAQFDVYNPLNNCGDSATMAHDWSLHTVNVNLDGCFVPGGGVQAVRVDPTSQGLALKSMRLTIYGAAF